MIDSMYEKMRAGRAWWPRRLGEWNVGNWVADVQNAWIRQDL